jgi:ComF family protein
MNIIESIMSSIAPHECVSCFREGSLLCDYCRQKLPGAKPRQDVPFVDAVHAVTPYEGAAKQLVWGMKFGRQKAAATVMAELLAAHLPAGSARDGVVTHVPTATSRVRQRGYDQAELIARQLAIAAHYQYLPLLARHGQQRQVGQDRTRRQTQLSSAFRLQGSPSRIPATVMVIDDVLTTGATLSATARALKQAGVLRVEAAVFAVARAD